MATLQDYRDERIRKLESLRSLGVNPYPASSTRTHTCRTIHEEFDELENQTVTITGRIKNIRKMGKIGFLVIEDQSGTVQIFLNHEISGADYSNSEVNFSDLPLLDTGDFLEVTGSVIRTKTNEISVHAHTLRMLAKSLRPMPLAHEEFSDKEQRLRRRYIDLNVNKDVRERFVRRSKFWQATRQFLLDEGFIEINIPVLEHTTGGADANPFVTHMDSLDQDFYLRISHELPLKRLIGGGYEKVFDIGPRFRNENYSDEHLPEHIAMESYSAYQDYQGGIDMYERMIKYVAQQTWGTLKFKNVNGFEVDLDQTWPRINYADIMKDKFGVDVFSTTLDELLSILKDNGVALEGEVNRSRALDNVWKLIRKTSGGPFWMIHEPVEISPLAKLDPQDPRVTQRFHPVIGGSELGNGFSELNDPQDQLARFLEQQQMRESGDDEAMMLDIDFVEMLEYGMPPACGWGNSERNFWFFEGVSAREGVVFPNLRVDIDETTKKIYPSINFEKTHVVDRSKLPLSAATQGTKKLYLLDWSTTKFEAEVVSVDRNDNDEFVIILDQTAFYPGGGGQPIDLGTITWADGSLALSNVTKDPEGIICHVGTLEGVAPSVGSKIKAEVDKDRRVFNSKLHCGGHLLDYGVRKLGLDWKSGKSSHFPGACYVRYEGDLSLIDSEEIKHKLEMKINDYIRKGGGVSYTIVPSEKASEISEYIPERVLNAYQNVNIACYPDGFNICCGGTHVQDVSEIGAIEITKIKKKDGKISVSYDLRS
ncbi:lysine--tRNA ligase [Candidatus Saccharibacteria bacterium]|nr:lysine--tRNA ligase [Candidatus Saccharibacteria bacterium]